MDDLAAAGGRPSPSGGLIGRRITLAVVGVALATLFVVGVVYYNFIGRYVLDQERGRTLAQAEQIAGQIENFGTELEMGPMMAGRALQGFVRANLQTLPAGASIIVYLNELPLAVGGPNRIVTFDAASALYQEAMRITQDGSGAIGFRVEDLDLDFIVAAAAFSFSESDGLVVITLPVPEAVAARQGLFRVLMYSGLFGVGLAVLVGLGLGTWLSRPLRRLSKAAARMAGGSYAEPVEGGFPGEVYELASSLETMRREVEHSEASLRGFVASAAHELRTPLTSIEGFSQALLDGTAATEEERQRSAAAVHRESARLRRLVEALLTLSRFDSREFKPDLVRVDVGAFVGEEVERLAEAGMVLPGRVAVRTDGDVTAAVDVDMLRQVVANLLLNAVQYGGDDPIEARVQVSGAWLEIYVKNGGIPLSTEDRERIFQRFYRGRSAGRQEGFGLGLPLVREICSVLGGDVTLVGSGPETVFRVRLPARSVLAATDSV
jgi:signal transduction histidine kinase